MIKLNIKIIFGILLSTAIGFDKMNSKACERLSTTQLIDLAHNERMSYESSKIQNTDTIEPFNFEEFILDSIDFTQEIAILDKKRL